MKTTFLRRVQTSKDMVEVHRQILKEKKMTILKKIFLQRTGCGTWNEACERHCEHVEKLEEFQRKYCITLTLQTHIKIKKKCYDFGILATIIFNIKTNTTIML